MPLFEPGDVGKLAPHRVDGFAAPIPAICYRGEGLKSPFPIGGIATGYLELRGDGKLGLTSLYNNYVPPMQAQGGALLTLIGKAGKETPLDAEHADVCVLAHFPVCNVRYALKDDSGAIVWLRVFTPILPGDAETSNTPGAVFEVSAEKFDGQVRVDIALAHNVEPVVKPLELGGGVVGAGRRYFKGSDYRASFTLQSFDRDGTAEASDERVRLAITAPSRQASRGGRCSRGTCRGGSTPAASRT